MRFHSVHRLIHGLFVSGACLAGLASVAGCDGPPERAPALAEIDLKQGRQLVIDKGCVACHAFPDVAWPRGGLGPALGNFARQGLIAGQLPNQPGVLMQFIRNAPALMPGTAMPAMPMTDQEARNVTAYLLQRQPR